KPWDRRSDVNCGPLSKRGPLPFRPRMTTISDRPVDDANPAALAQQGLFARAFGLRPRSSALDYLAIANELLVVAALTLALTLTFANTIARYAFNAGITWAPDLILICMAMMAFPGAAAFF